MADITVTGPDGSTFAFPEGTSGDAISGALSAHYNVSPAPPVAAPDKYTQAAQADYSKMKAAGYEPGYARRVMQGATFGGGDEIMAGLKRGAVFLKGRVAQLVALRQVPNIVFAVDEAFDNAARIAALLARPEVARDLHPPRDDEDSE